MGMFDTFRGWAKCAHCEELNLVDVQFKWLGCSLTDYTVGDYVDGHEPFSVFSEDEAICHHCDQAFEIYVLGKSGYLYGFCNEKEFAKIEERISFDDNTEYVRFLVSKEWVERNPEEALEALKQAYLNNPNEPNFVLSKEAVSTEELDAFITRIPSFVENPHHRLDVGDRAYYDNRNNYYEMWTLQDEPVTITKRSLDATGYAYLYAGELPDGTVFENIPEKKLINEDARQTIKARLEKAEKEILAYWEMKDRERDTTEQKLFRFRELTISLHYKELVKQLIAAGTLPQHFSLNN